MKKHGFTRVFSLLLALLIVLEMIPMTIFAAGISYYQTSKADVPIWSTASSKSTKIRTVSAKGTVLKVTGSTTNSSGNLWYQLSDGYWVFSGNVTKHSHSYSGGVCTGNSCGYEWPYSVSSASGTYVVTNTSGAKIWTRPYSHNSQNVSLAGYGSAHTVTGKTTNQEGNVWYRLSSGYWVFSGNVAQQFSVSYNANGGSGAPGTQYVLSGNSLTLSSQKPTRSGYVFQGWATSSGSSSVSYKAGSSYKFSSSVTLYAVWKSCSHSYKGGYCTSCGQEYKLSITTYATTRTFVVTNKDGAKIWSRPYSNNSTHMRTAAHNTALSITAKTTNADENTWYRLSDGNWVFSGNVTQQFTVSYNANGGSGAPGAQTFLSGKTLTLSSKKPTRAGYIFKGWATSASATKVAYKAGASYSTKKSITLYAVWQACSHSDYTGGYCDVCGKEYPLSISAYSTSLTFVVTNSDGAKIWSRPYSKNSTHVRTEKNKTALTVTAKVENADGNTWYRLSDGNWVYSKNVTRQYTVKYNANGGSGAPGAQTFLSGKTLKLSTKKPARVGYVFKGWATSASATEVKYKAGASYSDKKNVTLYAVWATCSHKDYTGGYCDVCKEEYNLQVTTYSSERTFIVTNDEGANVWSRPYSKSSTNVRVAKYKAALTVTAKVKNADKNTWYRLSDGNWVYSGNVTQQFTVKYNANGGKNAPSAQTFLSGKTLKLSTKKPKREGYIFQGWATSKSATEAKYKAGASYSVKKSDTLYAVWEKCKHEKYTGGYCDACGKEFKLKLETYGSTYTFQVTNEDGANIWSRPYSKNSTKLRKEKAGAVLAVTGRAENEEGNIWYRLSDGNWVYSKNIARQYKVTYDANGGKKAPSAQTFVQGKKLTLTTKEPVRDEYIFQGWATSPDAKTVKYAPGASYSTNKDVTLYAVWSQCTHEYKYGICKHCDHEWPHKLVDITNSVYKVNNSNGAASYKRPYSKEKEKKTTYEKGDVVLVTHEAVNENGAKWYKLKDGKWMKASELTKQKTFSSLNTVSYSYYTTLAKGSYRAMKISGKWYYRFTYSDKTVYLPIGAFSGESDNTSKLKDVSTSLTNAVNKRGEITKKFIYTESGATGAKVYYDGGITGVNYTSDQYSATLYYIHVKAGAQTSEFIYTNCTLKDAVQFTYNKVTEVQSGTLTATHYQQNLSRKNLSKAKIYPQFTVAVTESVPEYNSVIGEYEFSGYFTSYQMRGKGYAKKNLELADYIDLFTTSVDLTDAVITAASALVLPEVAIAKALYDIATGGWDLYTKVDSLTESKEYETDILGLSPYYEKADKVYRVYKTKIKSPIRLQEDGDYVETTYTIDKWNQGQKFKIDLTIK